ncbi:MAG TPA: SRPBCC domain-containing protein [Vicinamibacterales bacterium]|nr:SRPBCC domain-containing protein [Vicinamibacterales bacterium]
MAAPVDPAAGFDHTLLIAATPGRVMAAFFDPDALSSWWQAARSVTTPRAPGVYAIEWRPTPDADEILGRLGGVFHGTVIEYVAGRDLLVADAWWLPPDGDPIGPMALEVTCRLEGGGCRLRVRQSGFEDGARWRRYYDVIARGWMSSLAALKQYVEAQAHG